MGAGVSNAGYNQGDGMHVLNGTATKLLKGELVLWDNTTPVSTDKAPRVKRLTADGDPYFAGVCLTDIPANGGYGPIVTKGRVHARVASDVTAGGLLISDFVTSAAGRCKLKSSVGDGYYPVVGYALTAATEEPSTGSGSYWSDIMLDCQNAGGVQALLRGGGFATNVMTLNLRGVATASLPYNCGLLRVPVAGSITAFRMCVGDTTIAADTTANLWSFTLSTFGGTSIGVITNSTTLGDGAITAGTIRSANAITNSVVAAGAVLKIVAAQAAATAVDGQSGDMWSFWVEMDTGIGGTFPAMYAR